MIQMRDRTSEIREVMKNYPEFELITLRLSHAFDNAWWEGLAVKDLSRNFTADLLNEGTTLRGASTNRSDILSQIFFCHHRGNRDHLQMPSVYT